MLVAASACHHNCVHYMKVLRDVHCSLSLSLQVGATPLMIASQQGFVNVVHELLEAHADVNKETKVM